MEIIFTQIANLGFPIVVSIFLLVRIESKLTDITSSINQLTKAIISNVGEEAWWLPLFCIFLQYFLLLLQIQKMQLKLIIKRTIISSKYF